MSYKEPPPPFSLEPSWHKVLENELRLPYVRELAEFIASARQHGEEIYPADPFIFNALQMTPFPAVKAVLIGQDPYHGPGQAHGLCFSVNSGVPIPPSLRNIYKELHSDLGLPIPLHGSLQSWAEQGVLLLNATLTVKHGEPLSHYKIGWERLTDAIVTALLQRDQPLVFLLWGKSAQDKCQKLPSSQSNNHLILTAAHPSPFSAYKGFLGCKHFSQVNAFLENKGLTPILWRL